MNINNVRIEQFPDGIIAGMFGFAPEQFFEAQEADRAVPHVDFGTGGTAPAAPAPPADTTTGGTPGTSS